MNTSLRYYLSKLIAIDWHTLCFAALSWGSDSGNKPNANKKPEMDSEHQDSAEKHLMPTFFL